MRTLRFLMLALLLPTFVMTGCDEGGDEEKPTYTVTFDADGGTPVPAAQWVTEGETVAAPAAPAKSGYMFDGWYMETALTNKVAFPYVVTADITLYAKWTAEGGDEDTQIELPNDNEKTQEAFADDETTGGFTFTAKQAWTATVTVTENATRADGVEWLRLLFDGEETYSGAAGEFTLVIELDENYSGETRTATITIKSGDDTITITVTQDGKTETGVVPTPPDTEDSITLHDPDSSHYGQQAKQLYAWADETTASEFTFTATGNWTAVIGPTAGGYAPPITRANEEIDWLKIFSEDNTSSTDMYSGSAGEFTFSTILDENFTGEERSATITITCGNGSILIWVTQDGTTETGTVPVPMVDVLTKIPDAVFGAYCAENMADWDTDHDGILSIEEAAAVEYINVHSSIGATSLEGIEYFTALTYLNCNENQLTSLDVSKNTALTELYCFGNKLTSLDVSKNTVLTELYCQANQLTSLDVSKNTELTELLCGGNQLASLDVSKNIELTYLDCGSDQFTSLDVSKNIALTTLVCYGNKLTSLDVSKNTALTELYCYSNKLTSLDVSKNTALTKLVCDSNQLASLDVSKNIELTTLGCSYNQLTSLDVSKNTALTTLVCSYNPGNGTSFPITVWFDESSPVFPGFPSGGWLFGRFGNVPIEVEYIYL